MLQDLTYQLLSSVHSRTPILLFVNVIPYQNICTCWWSRKNLTHYFTSILFFWISLSMLIVFVISVIYYACNMLAWNSRMYIKVGTQTFVWHLNILCTFTLRNFSKRYKAMCNLFRKKLLFFNLLTTNVPPSYRNQSVDLQSKRLVVYFLYYLFWKLWCFLASGYFCNKGILINFSCINFC